MMNDLETENVDVNQKNKDLIGKMTIRQSGKIEIELNNSSLSTISSSSNNSNSSQNNHVMKEEEEEKIENDKKRRSIQSL